VPGVFVSSEQAASVTAAATSARQAPQKNGRGFMVIPPWEWYGSFSTTDGGARTIRKNGQRGMGNGAWYFSGMKRRPSSETLSS